MDTPIPKSEMSCQKAFLDKQAAAHGTADFEDIARLRSLGMKERGELIESACEAAAAVYRSRLAAGMPMLERDPWPESTVEFFRKHATRVRK
jgi:hypothetical protein